MKKTLLAFLLSLAFLQKAQAQCTSCTATTFDFDLSASVDTSVSVESVRNGDCCSGTNCIRFNVIINPGCSYVNFTVANPAPNGSAFYQINCGPQVSLATPVCVVGMTNVCISYCKPGNDAATYTITAAGAIQGSPDITLRQGCTGRLGVKGLILSTINWTSIFPGPQGAYNSYLSCVSACDTIQVLPPAGAPPYIDYQVSGNRICGPTVYDTIRVFTQPQMTVAITPVNPVVCPSGGITATLTATPSGGDAPYNFSWSTGATTPSIVVSTAGIYTVTISDSNSNCGAVSQPITVSALPVPPAPAITTNAPLCTGNTLNLFAATIPGATYSWTGPNGFTSTQQNPVINNVTINDAGAYSVTATWNGCPGPASTTNVTVNSIPASPAAASNSPVCTGSTLNLSATTIAGATYNWTGPNGFAASTQNTSVSNVTMANAGVYEVTATVNGCTSPLAATTVTINPLPSTPVITSNGPVCQGATILLNATSSAGATYLWTGPNGFSSSMQNPTIPNAILNNSGMYSVTTFLNGCAGTTANVLVTVNPTPLSPAAGSNGPLCEGSSLNLTASPVANATYNWSGPNSFSSSLQNPVISNITTAGAGLYSVTATVNGCTGPAGTVLVTVNPIPSAPVAASNSPLCAGNNLSLTAGTIAGASYTWSGPNGFSSSLQNPIITNAGMANAGTYNVTATVNGCTSNLSAITVIVNPIPSAPVISASSPVCTGSTILLTASPVAGASYSWNGPNGFTSSLQNPSIPNAAILHAGIYNATVTVNGCPGPASSTNVIVNPTPASPVATSNSPVCAGNTLNLSATTIAGATYNWTGPNGFTASTQNTSVSNVTIVNTGIYEVTATVNGCTSPLAATTVTVNPLPSTPVISSNGPVCQGATILLNATSTAGATYSWTGPNGFSSSMQNPTIPNASLNNSGMYSVTTFLNGCAGTTANVMVTVNPTPLSPAAGSNGPLCEGSILNLTASPLGNATYNWSGPNSFSSPLQNPVISNITTAGAGLYSVTATVNGCTGPAGTVLVTVNTIPSAPVAASNSPLCAGNNLSLTAGTITGASYTWSGPNGFSSSLQNPMITNAGMVNAGTYNVTATVNGCTSNLSAITVIVNSIPSAPVISASSPVCTGSTILLTASAVPGASYSWSGPNGFTSSMQNPSIPNAAILHAGIYNATVTVNGCLSAGASTVVNVNQTPNAPAATYNGPLCEGSILNLSASTITGAAYNWTGPNGFTASTQNSALPGVTITNAGQYQVTATVNGCTSFAGNTTVIIDRAAVANAGSDQTVCINSSAIQLSGSIAGGSTTGTWSTSGTGSFSPSNSVLNAVYIPSSLDKAGNFVSLTLRSTNNGACPASASAVRITFSPLPVANAGNDRSVCVNDPVLLNGVINNATGGIWSSSGTGTFSPSSTNLNPVYTPGSSDKARGSVILTLTTTGNGSCPAASSPVRVTINPLPLVNAGPDKYVVETMTTRLMPAVNGNGLKYLWSPARYLNSDTLLSPVCEPYSDITYTLTVTDNKGCQSSDDVSIKLLKVPVIPNVFTPNGDGINDTWEIKYLAAYPECTVEIYSRYGQLLFQSTGYTRPWNGMVNGKPLPAATYYYIINPKNDLKPFAGFVDLVR